MCTTHVLWILVTWLLHFKTYIKPLELYMSAYYPFRHPICTWDSEKKKNNVPNMKTLEVGFVTIYSKNLSY